MTITTAIKKAIEGGYKEPRKFTEWNIDKHKVKKMMLGDWSTSNGWSISIANILLDPDFWEALGKSMGWGYEEFGCGCKDFRRMKGQRKVWFGNWHRLIDHLASGKSIKSYFEEL